MVTKNGRPSVLRQLQVLLAHDTEGCLGKDVRKGQSGKILPPPIYGDCVKVKLYNYYINTAQLLN